MLEWLATVTAAEIGKVVLEQVLNLEKAAVEDYVKDFFKLTYRANHSQQCQSTLIELCEYATETVPVNNLLEFSTSDVRQTGSLTAISFTST